MNFRRRHNPAGSVLPASLLLALILPAIAWMPACDSPLEAETPRNRYSDGVSVLPSEDIGTAVSVNLVGDTTGTDTAWTPAHFSAALVFDASGTITALLNEYFKRAGQAFLDSLDGTSDQGAVVFFTSSGTVSQRMTSDTAALRTAVRGVPMTTGATAVWDGIYLAMLEVQSRGTHARRAVIAITDSDDNSSELGSPQSIIDLALRSDIAVYTISLRETAHTSILQNIAQQTGGKHYLRPLLSELTGIYREIAEILRAP